jgi:hypothetical protein
MARCRADIFFGHRPLKMWDAYHCEFYASPFDPAVSGQGKRFGKEIQWSLQRVEINETLLFSTQPGRISFMTPSRTIIRVKVNRVYSVFSMGLS